MISFSTAIRMYHTMSYHSYIIITYSQETFPYTLLLLSLLSAEQTKRISLLHRLKILSQFTTVLDHQLEQNSSLIISLGHRDAAHISPPNARRHHPCNESLIIIVSGHMYHKQSYKVGSEDPPSLIRWTQDVQIPLTSGKDESFMRLLQDYGPYARVEVKLLENKTLEMRNSRGMRFVQRIPNSLRRGPDSIMQSFSVVFLLSFFVSLRPGNRLNTSLFTVHLRQCTRNPRNELI